MDDPTNARVRLYLRSERARGLNSVPKRKRTDARPFPGDAEPEAPQAQASPSAPAPARPQSQPVSAEALFAGGVPQASAPGLAPVPINHAFTAPLLTTEEKRRHLAAMDEKEVRLCTRCRLCEKRTKTVFGEGDVDAKIFFIGEGPGETEDQTGRPFVGRAGELLNKMIAGMGLAREQVYIANVVKCRPPNNRVPAPDEVATCTPYLERQLEIIRPSAIVTLGLPATQYMLQTKLSMGKMRGQFHAWRGIPLMPTYHPAYVLRNPSYETRSAVWGDLKQVLAKLGLPVPKKNV